MSRYKIRTTETPTARQVFGLLFWIALASTLAGVIWQDWPRVVSFTLAQPWWFVPALVAVMFVAFLALLLWLELRCPVRDCQNECCADWGG